MIELRLQRREERRVLAGHDWVFSNEIDVKATPLKGLPAGEPIQLLAANGRFLAHGYVNPQSLIAVRLLSRNAASPMSVDVLRTRLERALRWRESLFHEPFYRWVFGESDGLPGLVIDRFDDVLVMQITTAGMERYLDALLELLPTLVPAQSICLANDPAVRELEGLERYRRWQGPVPSPLVVRENDLVFEVPDDIRQKTGWFYDHRASRSTLRRWVSGARVLDVYSFLGAFAINALAGGAREVVSLDASASAVDAARHNAELNGVASRLDARCDDAVEAMRQMREQGEQFDVIVLDPPAFIKRRKDREAGLRHYGLNNRLAMSLLAPEGVLFSASCSQALSLADLHAQLRKSLPRRADGIQVLADLHQDVDHPVHLSMPETRYLKGSIVRVL